MRTKARIHAAAVILAVTCLPSLAQAMSCSEAAAAVAAEKAAPLNIITAIIKVESDFDPFAFNVDGKSYAFDDRYSAYAFLRRQIAAGRRPDAGCMQMNYGYHKQRFESLADFLVPYRNVAAGTDYLIELKDRCGSWECAAGMFHSPSDPVRNRIYRCRLARVLNPGKTFPYCAGIEQPTASSTKKKARKSRGPRYSVSISSTP